MKRITISLEYKALKMLEDLREKKYPHCKKVSRMLLEMGMTEAKRELDK